MDTFMGNVRDRSHEDITYDEVFQQEFPILILRMLPEVEPSLITSDRGAILFFAMACTSYC